MFSLLSALFGSCHILFSDHYRKGCMLLSLHPRKICGAQRRVKWYWCLRVCLVPGAARVCVQRGHREFRSLVSLLGLLPGSGSISLRLGEMQLCSPLCSPKHSSEFIPPVPLPLSEDGCSFCAPESSDIVLHKATAFVGTSGAVYPLWCKLSLFCVVWNSLGDENRSLNTSNC